MNTKKDIDEFLREEIKRHPDLKDSLGDFDKLTVEVGSLAEVLIRLRLLTEEKLGLVARAVWGLVELEEGYDVFDKEILKTGCVTIPVYNSTYPKFNKDNSKSNNIKPEAASVKTAPYTAAESLDYSSKLAEVQKGGARSRPRIELKPGLEISESTKLIRPISTGGSANIWKAWHENLEIHVAVKFLRTDIEYDPEKFLNEAHNIARLNHPNIVRVYNCGTRNGTIFIEMEYVKGASLGHLIRAQASFSHVAAVEAVLCVAMALGHASRRGMLHRDVKPDNIMVTVEGVIKLTDFGLSEPVMGSVDLTADDSHCWFAGTPAFMAPELIDYDLIPDCRADIYSLGVTLVQLVTGQLPFLGKNMMETLRMHKTVGIPDIGKYGVHLESLQPIVNRMLAKDRNERYNDYNEITNDLINYIAAQTRNSLRGSQWGDEIISHEFARICRKYS